MSGTGKVPEPSAEEIEERAGDGEIVQKHIEAKLLGAGEVAAFAAPEESWEEFASRHGAQETYDLLADLDGVGRFSDTQRMEIFRRGFESFGGGA